MFASHHEAAILGEMVALRLSASQVNLFHCGLVLAGQPDLLMTHEKGNIIIVDWKRSRQIRFDNDRCSLKYPLSHLPDSWRRSCFSVFVPLTYPAKTTCELSRIAISGCTVCNWRCIDTCWGPTTRVEHACSARPCQLMIRKMRADMSTIPRLETEYGMNVSATYLAVVHPDNDAPRLISCPRLQEELNLIVAYEMECGRARAAALPGPDAPFVC